MTGLPVGSNDMNDSFGAQTIRIKPYYVFSAISLALVILLLAILFPRESVYVAEAQLSLKPAAVNETIPATELQAIVRNVLSDPQFVERAVAGLAPELNAGLGIGADSIDALKAIVTPQLDFQLSDESAEQRQLTIRFGNSVRTTAVKVVTAVAEEFAKSFHKQAGVDDALGARVADLKKRITDVQQRRQQFVDRQIALRQEAISGRELVNAEDRSQDSDSNLPNARELSREAIPGQAHGESQKAQEHPAVSVQSDMVVSTQEQSGQRLDGSEPLDESSTPIEGTEGTMGKSAEAVQAEPYQAVDAGQPLESDLPADADSPPAMSGGAETQTDAAIALKDDLLLAEPGLPVSTKLPGPSTGGQVSAPSWGGSAAPESGGNALSSDAPLSPPSQSLQHSQQLNVPQVVEPNPDWIEISEEIAGLRTQLREMLKIYTPKHPLAHDTMRRIEELELKLRNTQQFIEIPSDQTGGRRHSANREPTPTFGPMPAIDSQLTKSTSSSQSHGGHDQQPAEWAEEAAQSDEYRKLTEELEQLRSELVRAEQQQQQRLVALQGMSVEVSGEPQVRLVRTGSLSPLDILTYLVPACVVGLAASVIRNPQQPPLALYSVADVEDAMGLQIVGAISTTDGPEIPAPEGGGPPNSIVRLVFASEVVLVATAVVLVISSFQIPDFIDQLRNNPISALVLSIDYSLDFIRGFF